MLMAEADESYSSEGAQALPGGMGDHPDASECAQKVGQGIKSESVPSDVSSSMSSCSRPPTPRTMHSGLQYSKHRSSFRLSGNRLPLIFTIVLELVTFTRVLEDIQGACIH